MISWMTVVSIVVKNWKALLIGLIIFIITIAVQELRIAKLERNYAVLNQDCTKKVMSLEKALSDLKLGSINYRENLKIAGEDFKDFTKEFKNDRTNRRVEIKEEIKRIESENKTDKDNAISIYRSIF